MLNFKRKMKEREYKKYIEEHKENIRDAFVELSTCPDLDWLITADLSCKLYQRILIHDDSKYSDEEFCAYRLYYYPTDKYEKILGSLVIDKAFEHHYQTNRHHWQARQYDEDELTEEYILDCLENICDWLAMGYKFNDRPIQYYNKIKEQIKLPVSQRIFMERVMNDLEKTKRDMSQYGKI